MSESVPVARGKWYCLRADEFEALAALIRRQPWEDVNGLIPMVTVFEASPDGTQSNGGLALDLADIVARIDEERAAKPAVKPADAEDTTKIARMDKARAAAEAHG